MPWPVYSERLVQNAAGAGAVDLVIPAGHRAVLTEIAVTNLSGTTTQVTVYVAGGIYWDRKFLATDRVFIQPCRVVIYAGEVLRLAKESSTTTMTCSGYLFGDSGQRVDLEASYDPDFRVVIADELPAAPGRARP